MVAISQAFPPSLSRGTCASSSQRCAGEKLWQAGGDRERLLVLPPSRPACVSGQRSQRHHPSAPPPPRCRGGVIFTPREWEGTTEGSGAPSALGGWRCFGSVGPGEAGACCPESGLWVSRQLPEAEAGARSRGRAGRGGGRSAALLLLHCSLPPSLAPAARPPIRPSLLPPSLPPRVARCTMAAPSPGPGSGSGPGGGSQAAHTAVSSMQGKGARLRSGNRARNGSRPRFDPRLSS